MTRTVNVSTQEELISALEVAEGGETILLAGGDYGDLHLRSWNSDLSFDETVTITSADPADPAIFTEAYLDGARNLTIDGLVFDYRYSESDVPWHMPFQFRGSTNLTIKNSVFDGDVASGRGDFADGYGYASGVSLTGEGIVFDGNEMHTFWKGIRTGGSKDVVITNNDIHSIRSDGINFVDTDGILIEGNHLHDFITSPESGDHADMIQTWTDIGLPASRDIVIRGNRFDVGEGNETQTIFLTNQAIGRGGGEEYYFRNITVEDNLIINKQANGIILGETFGVTVKGNTLVHPSYLDDLPSRNVEIPRIGVDPSSKDVVIEKNIASDIRHGEGPDWTVSDNVTVQNTDPTQENYVDTIFVSSTIGTDYAVLPAGAAGTVGAGVRILTDDILAQYHAEATDAATRVFDAGHALVGDAKLPDGTRYEWDFGDGTTAEGIVVEHGYADSGRYDVTLRITLPDGQSASVETAVQVAPTEIVSYAAGGSVTMVSGPETHAFQTDAMGEDGFRMSGDVGPLKIDAKAISVLADTPAFTIDMGFTLDAGSGGMLFMQGRAIRVSIDGDGDLNLLINMENGRQKIEIPGAGLNDGQSHQLSVAIDEGRILTRIDGKDVDDTELNGPIKTLGDLGFTVGNPWGASVEGMLSSLSITTDDSMFPDEPRTQVLVPQMAVPVAPDDTQSQADHWETIASYDAESGFTREESGQAVAMDVDHVASQNGFVMGSKGVAAAISRAELSQMTSGKGFHVGFTIDAAEEQAGGQTLMHIAGGGLSIWVRPDGELKARAHVEGGGVVRSASEGASMTAPGKKEVDIVYTDGTVEIFVDGRTALSMELGGALSSHMGSGLWFGNPWKGGNFEAEIDDLEISALTEDMDIGEAVESLAGDLQMAPEEPMPDFDLLPELPQAEHWERIARYDSEVGFTRQENGQTVALDVEHVASQNGFVMGNNGVAASISRADMSQMMNGEGFHVGFTVDAAEEQSGGHTLMHIAGGGLSLWVRPNGEISARAHVEGGESVKATSEGVSMTAPGKKEVDIVYADETVEVLVDGQTALSMELGGPLSSNLGSGLWFGNPWKHGGNFEAEIDDLEISALTEDMDIDAAVDSLPVQDDLIPTS